MPEFLAPSWLNRAQSLLRRGKHVTCPRCAFDLQNAPLYREWRVCDNCGHHFSLNAYERIKLLTDGNSFHELERYLVTHPRGIEYARRVRKAKRETPLRESVVIGTAEIDGRQVMLIVLDFRFLGGTMGEAAGEKIARAFESARGRRLPVIAITASGGARIQEGMTALMQMAKTVSAVNQFQETGLPYITVLTNPTTGGVYASFANLADIILAEPRALIGFAGPRVVEILTHEKLPKDSHRAEFLLKHGMVDAILPRMELRNTLSQLLTNILAEPSPTNSALFPGELAAVTRERGQGDEEAWSSVQLARHPARPTTRDYIARVFTNFIELHGDRLFGDDPAIICGAAQLEMEQPPGSPESVQGTRFTQAVVVIGHERGHGESKTKHHEGRAEPEGYRKAQRLMKLASKWGLPVITFVDTPGADPGYESEKRGIAMSLAHSISTMLESCVPTIAIIIGEGGSGGALALAAADRVAMLEYAVYSVISPEGASAILFGDANHAPELASELHLTARDLVARRIVDTVIEEPAGGAHMNADAAAAPVKAFLVRELTRLGEIERAELMRRRYARYRAAE